MIVLVSLPLAEVDFDQSVLYSTIILAILLTGKNRPDKFLSKLWEMMRWRAMARMASVSRRQIMYYGLRWGIPLTQLKKLLSTRHKVVRKRSSGRKKRGNKNVNRTVRSGFSYLENSLSQFSVRNIYDVFLVGNVLIFYTSCKRGPPNHRGFENFN